MAEMKYKDGTQTERECICQAVNEGWDREHIGSHIIGTVRSTTADRPGS